MVAAASWKGGVQRSCARKLMLATCGTEQVRADLVASKLPWHYQTTRWADRPPSPLDESAPRLWPPDPSEQK